MLENVLSIDSLPFDHRDMIHLLLFADYYIEKREKIHCID